MTMVFMWQDTIILACMLAFSYALVPQVMQGFREKKALVNRQTSLITSAGMYVLAAVYLTLNLYLSAAIGLFTGSLWAVLLWQGVRYGKK